MFKINNFRIPARRMIQRYHGSSPVGGKKITLKWHLLKDDSIVEGDAIVGMNLMRAAQRIDVPLEGACEGVTACSTCHVVLGDDVFDNLPEAEEAEDDMLDQAFGLTPTSRLGCQVIITEEMDGITIQVPAATRNFYVDGHVPQPH